MPERLKAAGGGFTGSRQLLIEYPVRIPA